MGDGMFSPLLHGNVIHTWTLPYAPGLGGYLTGRGTLIDNGRTPASFGRFFEVTAQGETAWEAIAAHRS